MTVVENKPDRVLIVLPVYNEEKFIKQLVDLIMGIKPDSDILTVNDGSIDETAAVLAQLPVKVVEHDSNQGKGAAIRSAIKYAKSKHYDWIITLDGDGQHPPEFIIDFIAEIEKNNSDLILGNRQERDTMPAHRRLSNGTTSIMVSLCAGNTRIHDSQCGFRALRLSKFNDRDYRETGFQFESEMILRMGKSGFRISQVPVTTRYGDEASSINLVNDTLKFVKLIIHSFFW